MYRIFCESYSNFANSMKKDSVRLQMAKPLELLTDKKKYDEEKEKKSEIYQKTSDLLAFLEEKIETFPRAKAFLWTIASRDMYPQKYNISEQEELYEQAKLLNSFLKLAYWY